MTNASTPGVPFLDLSPQHEALKPELEAALLGVLHSQRFILGGEGKALEAEVASLVGTQHAIGCASGSDALSLALKALDVGDGQAIVTTSQTFFATVGAAARHGTRVDFVDVEPGTMNMDPDSLAAFLAGCSRDADGTLREPRSNTPVAAIVAVDLFGRPCQYERIEALAREYGLKLIEDAAQSIGAGIGERRCGAFGDVATFSFYPTKNLGGAGDGGMLTTNDEALAERLARLRVHGQSSGRYFHSEVGWNSRLDELQAAVLRVKLPHLAAWNDARRAHARAYDEAFADLAAVTPLDAPAAGVDAIYHLYVTRAERRDELQAHLRSVNVGCGVYYPLPLHLQECFAYLGYREGDLPVAEAASQEVISLPLFPELTPAQRDRVIAAVRDFYR